MELNGLHINALNKLVKKLDKLALNHGTHLVEGTFKVYDQTGEARTVTIKHSDEDGHYLEA